MSPGTAIAVPAKRDQRRRALLAGDLCWLSTPLQGQAIIDTALPTGSTTRDPLHAEIARIEQYGSKYVLTTYCRVTSAVILKLEQIDVSEAELARLPMTAINFPHSSMRKVAP